MRLKAICMHMLQPTLLPVCLTCFLDFCLYDYSAVVTLISHCLILMTCVTSTSHCNQNVACCFMSDAAMNVLIDSSPTSPSEGRQEAGSVQSSDSEFYWGVNIVYHSTPSRVKRALDIIPVLDNCTRDALELTRLRWVLMLCFVCALVFDWTCIPACLRTNCEHLLKILNISQTGFTQCIYAFIFCPFLLFSSKNARTQWVVKSAGMTLNNGAFCRTVFACFNCVKCTTTLYQCP